MTLCRRLHGDGLEGNVSAAEDWLGQWIEDVRADPNRLELPLLPRAAADVLALSESEDATAHDISNLIHRDPALAAHVLRVANSPMFCGRTEIVTLQQAVARLGTGQLTELLFAASVGTRIFQVTGYESRIRRLWNLSLVAGLMAKEIARHLRHNVEGSFLCGLLHDIGTPVVLQALLQERDRTSMLLSDADLDATLSTLSPTVGAGLVKRWQLPAPLGEAIRHFRNYDTAESYPEYAALTHLAVKLATIFASDDQASNGAGENDAANAEQLVQDHGLQPVLAALNIYPDEFERLLAHQEKVLVSAEAMNR